MRGNMNNAFGFTFGLTTICDKKCLTCCNNYDEIKKTAVVDYDKYLLKLNDIKHFISTSTFRKLFSSVSIALTGGEALLYFWKDKDNTSKNIVDIVKLTHLQLEDANIIIKTSGFCANNSYAIKVFDELSEYLSFPYLDFRFGFNLFQKSGVLAAERLQFTLERILRHQLQASIDTIYNVENLSETYRILEETLNTLGFNVDQGFMNNHILSDPKKRRRFILRDGDKKVSVDTGPAYSPGKMSAHHEYYDATDDGCSIIKSGPNSLYYDPNLDLIHCNDPYIDFSISPMKLSGLSSADQFKFLCNKFAEFKTHMSLNNVKFNNRKERCFYCTKSIMVG
jgi:hypothetical protein